LEFDRLILGDGPRPGLGGSAVLFAGPGVPQEFGALAAPVELARLQWEQVSRCLTKTVTIDLG
jgi:hypothetical protein